MRAADVLVLNSVFDIDLFPIMAKRAARNAVTVFEIADDFTGFQPWNPVYHFFQSASNQRLCRQLARAATAIQYVSAELERLFGHLGQHNKVFVNHLLDLPAQREPRRKPGPVVVGWGGSSGHREDMARIAPALCEWVTKTPSVTLSLMCSDSIWNLFSTLSPARKRRTPTGTIDAYYRFVGTLDIGLAPLEDTAFNRSRSDVKFLEYAAYGAVALLQDLVPYRNSAVDRETARFFRTTQELIALLDQLTANPEERARLATAAYDRVARGREQRAHAAERIDYYASLEGAGAGASVDASALFDEIATWKGAEVTERHAVLSHTQVESKMHDALVLSQHEQRHSEARSLLSEAARLCPELDLPHLYLGGLYGEESALEQALERNPDSVTALMGLGRLEMARGALGPALGHFISAVELAPRYDEPYRLAASAAERLGATNDARSLAAVADQLVAQSS
jgi:tetratricopeptide (TPR) repeat protein